MKTLLTIMTICLLAFPSFSAEKACDNAINVGVNGLVCDFCARALEKVFSKQEAVGSIAVDLDSSLVKVHLKPGGKIDNATLTKLITDSGYNVTAIERGC